MVASENNVIEPTCGWDLEEARYGFGEALGGDDGQRFRPKLQHGEILIGDNSVVVAMDFSNCVIRLGKDARFVRCKLTDCEIVGGDWNVGIHDCVLEGECVLR